MWWRQGKQREGGRKKKKKQTTTQGTTKLPVVDVDLGQAADKQLDLVLREDGEQLLGDHLVETLQQVLELALDGLLVCSKTTNRRDVRFQTTKQQNRERNKKTVVILSSDTS